METRAWRGQSRICHSQEIGRIEKEMNYKCIEYVKEVECPIIGL